MKNNDSFKQTINEIIKNFNLGFFAEAETLVKKNTQTKSKRSTIT